MNQGLAKSIRQLRFDQVKRSPCQIQLHNTRYLNSRTFHWRNCGEICFFSSTGHNNILHTRNLSPFNHRIGQLHQPSISQQYSFLSSTPETSTSNTVSPTKCEERTNRLIDKELNPIGSFTQLTIREIISVLRDWASIHENHSGIEFLDEIRTRKMKDDYANKYTRIASEKVFELFHRVQLEEQECWKTKYPDLKGWKVTPEMYELVIKTMVQGTEESIQKAIFLLDHLEKIQYVFLEDTANYQNLLYCYIHILHAITKPHIWSHDWIQDAFSILERMKKQKSKFFEPNIKLDTMALNTELNLYAMNSDGEGATEVFYKAKTLEKDNYLYIDTSTYATLMKAWIQSSQASGERKHKEIAAQKCQEILEEMMKVGASRKELKPNTLCFTSVIRSWAISNIPGSAERAHNILTWMEDSYTNEGNHDAKPNDYTYNSVIYAYAHDVENNGSEQAEKLLFRMIEMYGNGESTVKPDIMSFNSVLRGWALQKGNPSCGERAEAILNLMDELYDTSDIKIKPDSQSFNSVMQAYSISGQENALFQAENISHKMNEFNEIHGGDVSLSRIGYTSLIRSLVKNGQIGDAIKAEMYINEMEDQYAEGDEMMKPEPFVYNMVCNAYAKEGNVEKAFTMFNRILTLFENGDKEMKPSIFTYTTILNALANSTDNGAADKAQSIFDGIISMENDELIKTELYNAVMKAWSRSKDNRAPEQVLNLLQHMEGLNQEGYSHLKPDLFTYNTIISTLSKSRKPGSAYKAEAMLDVMRKMADESDENIGPDTITYSSVIHALSLCREQGSAEKAEELLIYMEDEYRNGNVKVKPNTHTFTSVITAHTSKRTPEGAERAESILNRMEETQGVKPNKVTYSAVIDAWAKSGDSNAWKNANRILNRMKKQSLLGQSYLKPNIYSYSSVLSALAHSRERGKARKALRFLRKMAKNPDSQPNLYTYNAVLSAAAYTRGGQDERNDALHIAIMILEEALNNAEPHERAEVTYGLFFTGCRNLCFDNPHRVKNIVDEVFSRCCDDGRVDGKILSQIRSLPTPSLIQDNFGELTDEECVIRIDECPSSWSRNVSQRTYSRKLYS